MKKNNSQTKKEMANKQILRIGKNHNIQDFVKVTRKK